MKLLDGSWHTRETVVRQYERLVCQQAYQLSRDDWTIREDLQQEGYIGLLQAYDRYDADNGCKFITFAYSCIRIKMIYYKRRSNPLSGVTGAKDVAIRISQEDLWDRPDEEVAKRLEVSVQRVRNARIYNDRRQPVSPDAVTDGYETDAYQRIGETQDTSTVVVNAFLARLTDRERRIARGYMDGYDAIEIGEMVGLGRQRVYQIRKILQRKLENGGVLS